MKFNIGDSVRSDIFGYGIIINIRESGGYLYTVRAVLDDTVFVARDLELYSCNGGL
jgi:hypothetical protein